MCGISGIWSGNKPNDKEDRQRRLWAMVETIRHRGPDGEGIWDGGAVGLAHTRLAILDLSDAGAQPMRDPEQEIFITYNGEIYNFQELRDELSALGHRFHTGTDTEVVIEGYKRFGTGIISRLRGMFAFGLWDSRSKTLLLARDRIGKKPLYYGWYDDCLYFGSEIKSVLAGSGMPREADLSAIDRYLTYQYVPDTLTGFKNIKKLRPGNFMTVGADATVEITPYWQPPDPSQTRDRPVEELAAELVERFDEAVKYRMIADVPVGAFLSGGIDSASVVASMARTASGPVKTFTMGFEEPAYDEREPARLVAEMNGTEHHEHVVKPDVIAIMDKLVWHYGMPYADSSAVPSFCVSELARQHVKVALNGDGGDETFLGYSRYKAAKIASRLDRVPMFLREAFGFLGQSLPFAASEVRYLRYAKRFLTELASPPSERYGRWMCYFNDDDKDRTYGPVLRDRLKVSALAELAPFFEADAPVEACAAWADFHGYLPDDLLVKIDIATMSCGLEARSPFLDHPLIEFSAAIPAEIKMQGLDLKTLLKKAMKSRLPAALLDRPKTGFGVPIDAWFRQELKEMAYDTLLSRQAIERGLFDRTGIQKLLDDHVSGKAANHYRLWALLFLELWFRMWIDGATLPQRPTTPAIRIL